MKKIFLILTAILALTWAPGALGADKPSHGSHGQVEKVKGEAMEHTDASAAFTHKAVVDGIRAEFQIMSLASMKMKDPGGATHHIMVKFFDDAMNHQIKKLAGKVKVIAPSGKDQVGTLKDYSGIYAANVTFDENGKWGVICLFKVEDKKHTVKFWYPHK